MEEKGDKAREAEEQKEALEDDEGDGVEAVALAEGQAHAEGGEAGPAQGEDGEEAGELPQPAPARAPARVLRPPRPVVQRSSRRVCGKPLSQDSRVN